MELSNTNEVDNDIVESVTPPKDVEEVDDDRMC